MRIEGTIMKTNNPDEVRYCCSECGDGGFHLYYNLKKQVYHCFKCGRKGKQEPEKLYTDERLQEMVDILSGKTKIMESEKFLTLPDCGLAHHNTLATQYMRKRGISEEKLRDMRCLVSDDPLFDYRIIIPVYDESANIVYYQARALLSSIEPRYINPIYPKREALFYNMYRRLPNVKKDHLFLTEGIFKALNLWRIEEPAVAILGKEITLEQCKKVWRLTNDITVLLDPDALTFSLDVFDKLQLLQPEGGKVRAWNPPVAVDNLSVVALQKYVDQERRRCCEVL